MKALLFINGVFPQSIPSLEDFDIIACTDGAFSKLIELNFPIERLDFVSGDFDSHIGNHLSMSLEKFIYTPDQSKTDFHKSLEILQNKGVVDVHVYGASGGEMDHFLGNLTTAVSFKNELQLTFFDAHAMYFFLPKVHTLHDVKGKMISLYPFPIADKVITKGLHWDLDNAELSIHHQTSTRNYADENKVSIHFEGGELLVFIGKKYR